MAAPAALTKALYRALLQTTRSLDGPLRLRLPVSDSAAQWMSRGEQFGFVPPLSAAQQLFPSSRGYAPLPEANALEIEPEAVRHIVRSAFRMPPVDGAGIDGVDTGLHALKVLHGQLAMARRSSAARTTLEATGAAVLVEATSIYRGRDGPSYVFQYRIRVCNVGAVPIQVVGRQWDIRNADGTVHASVPRGSPGVVGQTPRLLPGGECFEYASGTTLATPHGSVEGSLQMMSLGSDGREAQQHFDAKVARFVCDASEEER